MALLSSILNTITFPSVVNISSTVPALSITQTGTGDALSINGIVQPDVAAAYYARTATYTSANGGVPYTVGSITHYYAGQGTFNADSTVTSQYGFSVASTLTGATNNYGFISSLAAAAGAYNFYAAGTAQNYFAGATSFGSTLTVTGSTTLATALGGVLKATAGLVSAATAGTDYLTSLSGAITSAGNTTSLGSFTYAQLNTAISDATIPSLTTAQTFSGGQRGAVTSLTSTTAAITINLNTSNNFSHITTQNSTLAAPTNPVAGQSGVITITQGATAFLLAYNTFWKFPGGTVPTLTARTGAVDVLAYYIESGTRGTCQLIKDVK